MMVKAFLQVFLSVAYYQIILTDLGRQLEKGESLFLLLEQNESWCGLAQVNWLTIRPRQFSQLHTRILERSGDELLIYHQLRVMNS